MCVLGLRGERAKICKAKNDVWKIVVAVEVLLRHCSYPRAPVT